MLTDISFAERIIEKYKYFGIYRLFSPILVFVREKKDIYTHQTTRNILMKLQLSLVQDVHVKKMRGRWETEHTRELTTIKKTINTFLKHTQILELVKTAVLGPVWKQPQLIGQVRTLAGWETAHRLEQYYRERDAAFLPQTEKGGRILRVQGQSILYEETKEQLIRRQVHQQEEFMQTKNQVSLLEERMTSQEQILRELRQTTEAQQKLRPEQIDGITKAVIKKMEQELHLEKLRRGLY